MKATVNGTISCIRNSDASLRTTWQICLDPVAHLFSTTAKVEFH